MAEGGEGVCAEVGGLEAGGARARYRERYLEVLVQRIKEAVGEALGSVISECTATFSAGRGSLPKGRKGW